MADHVLLEAGDDLVRQLSHEREAVKAVLELVWNSLDADATKVDVTLVGGSDAYESKGRLTVARQG
ncbi:MULTISPECIES: ATP-binding protein [unclassified Streptomyces]|uniref:ATP-binding protein n=1 Tax=unclassified Streptomyces TaxID=2593676 RepID=UPI002DDA1AAA|nr:MULTISPECIES: ATP-binding protein [unclassified Streptomyces]WSA73325.1 ATP-binding protein [Streptomyces sp. NBC_01800]WUC25033.1 ATP-binding protein [Streptomyces sp. NBC_00562]